MRNFSALRDCWIIRNIIILRNLLSFSVGKLFSYFHMWMRIVLDLVMYINMKIMTFWQ